MAKTIKFNLICDNKPIRTIDDLQENFSIEDVLQYYENGLLKKWLQVRGYTDEEKKVSEVDAKDNMEIVMQLASIFNVEADKKKLEEGVYVFEYQRERAEKYASFETTKKYNQKVIKEYWAKFNSLVGEMIDNAMDIARIKSIIHELMGNYREAMDATHRNLFWSLAKKNATLPIMCLLMNEHARKYYLPMPIENDQSKVKVVSLPGEVGSLVHVMDTETDADKKEMYDEICRIVRAGDLEIKLGEHLHKFSGKTEEYWKDIEKAGKKYMIIRIGNGDFVRSEGKKEEEYSKEAVEYKFLILNGIDYKSNISDNMLLYMEV